MTRVIAVVKNNKLIESIREIVLNTLKAQSQINYDIQKDNLPDSKKIVRSNHQVNDEFGYFNKIER